MERLLKKWLRVPIDQLGVSQRTFLELPETTYKVGG